MFKRISLALAVAAVLAGCSSSGSLDKAPLDTTNGGAVSTQGGATGQSTVAPVDLTGSQLAKAGPANVARIIYFDYDSFVVKPEFQSVLEAHARFIRSQPQASLMIEGHTDERGGREYNLALGQKRAEAVRRALSLMGVQEAQIEAVSYGEEKPAVAGYTEDAFSKNRRAELNYR